MKILFLDIEGVLITSKQQFCMTVKPWGCQPLDPRCVFAVQWIVERTGCEIVVSSGWRLRRGLSQIGEIFKHFGLPSPLGVTPIDRGEVTSSEVSRSREILEVIGKNPSSPWCAVDDMDLSLFMRENFVQASRWHEGISQPGLKERIVEILNTDLGKGEDVV